MKKGILIFLAIVFGVLTITALFLRAYIGPVLSVLLFWGMVLVSMALIIGLGILFFHHLKNVVKGRKGFFYSLIVILGFIISLAGGLILGTDDQVYQQWVTVFQAPIEISLVSLMTFALIYVAFRLYKQKGWSPLSISFGISVFISIIIRTGFFQQLDIPLLQSIITYIERIPIAGARGILIGISLGALLTAIRLIVGVEHPYGD
jgi:hypothetical protein